MKSKSKLKILVLGATGMLGNAVMQLLGNDKNLEIIGTIRSSKYKTFLSKKTNTKILDGVDVGDEKLLLKIFAKYEPNVVINCIGLVKQLSDSQNPLKILPINSLLPHKILNLCNKFNSRLIHVSTDCVFDGKKGNYKENDTPNARDLYGISKYLGEIHNNHKAITLRTSIIGHELDTSNALVDWFLSQKNECKGFSQAIFSGLPTFELARIIKDVVIPNKELSGLYHISSSPITKYKLLKIIAKVYKKDIEIIKDGEFVIDRSLNSEKFRFKTGYKAPSWPKLIEMMYFNRLTNKL